ncbi:MAG: Arabinose efflux permease [uncultured Paraburkholderia sp.]|nr:MAG: Arabinose efflux permease [uncultured Paraburkholderia sp.]
MNIIWYVLRPFYLLGLVLAVPLFFIVANHAGKDLEVSVPLLIGCLGYFVLGYLLLKTLPNFLRGRVLARVANFKAKGFAPQWQVVSVIYTATSASIRRRAKRSTSMSTTAPKRSSTSTT